MNRFEEKIQNAVNLIHSNLRLDFVFLWMIDNNWLILTGAGKDMRLMTKKKEISNGIAGSVFANKTYKVLWDLTPDEEMLPFSSFPFPDTHSVIALPIFYSTTVVGVLELGSTIHCDFREDEIEVYKYLADQIAEILLSRL